MAEFCLCLMVLRMTVLPMEVEEWCCDLCCFESVSMLPDDLCIC